MQNKELHKQLQELKSQIIDFDEVVVSPDSSFHTKSMETMESEKNMLDIPDPFDIDVD